MAVRVGYFESPINKDIYLEGPFVMVNANGWRIEVQYKDSQGVVLSAPALPDDSIYGFLRERGLPTDKQIDEDLTACLVDYLNAKGKDGTLIFDKYTWTWPIYESLLEAKRYQEKRFEQLATGTFAAGDVE